MVCAVRRKLTRVISASDMKKKLPEFRNEDGERNFWATADSTEYVNWQVGKRRQLVQLKPSLKTISLRIPVSVIEDLKILANRRSVPYQSVLKVSLAERVVHERQREKEPRPITK